MNIPVIVDWDNKLFRYVVEIEDNSDTYYLEDYDLGYFTRMDTDYPTEPALIQFVHGEDNLEIYNNLVLEVPQDLHATDPTSESPLYPSHYGNPDYSHDQADPTQYFVGDTVKVRNVRLNIPLYNITTYQETDYCIKFTTWIAGKEIVLGSKLITRENHKAIPYKMMYGERYMECVEMTILDPWSLVYEDQWIDWRHNICGEPEQLNNTGSSLNVSIWPITKDDNYYTLTPKSGIGSSNISIIEHQSSIQGRLGFEENSSNLRVDLLYNDIYTDLVEYMKETYLIDIDDLQISYTISIRDDEDLYDLLEVTPENPSPEPNSDHVPYYCVIDKNELDITGWDSFVNGEYIRCYIDIKNGEEKEEEGDNIVMSIITNDLLLTPDIYKYLIQTPIDGIELKLVNMYQYTVNAVNKIEKTVVQVDNAKEYKSKIIKPVFFQAHKLGNIIIHPEVTENISINLNAYKSKTDFFYIKIEGVVFPEIGRNHTGVIFKIQGSLLPKEVEEGQLYILNQDKELVTTGSFKYIM